MLRGDRGQGRLHAPGDRGDGDLRWNDRDGEELDRHAPTCRTERQGVLMRGLVSGGLMLWHPRPALISAVRWPAPLPHPFGAHWGHHGAEEGDEGHGREGLVHESERSGLHHECNVGGPPETG